MAKSKRELQRITKKLVSKAKRFGLHINQQKTKYIVMGGVQQQTEDHLQLKTHERKERKFEKVNNSVYLGVVIKEGKEEIELKVRLTKGNWKYGEVGRKDAESHKWMRRINRKLKVLYNKPSISIYIKTQCVR